MQLAAIYNYQKGSKRQAQTAFYLFNLLDNAVKFTQRGEVHFEAETIHKSNQIYLQIKVRDTGVGIEAEKVSKIFEAFDQVMAGEEKHLGVGLGLAVSSRFAL